MPVLSSDRETLHAKRSLRPEQRSLEILAVDDNRAAVDAIGKLLTMRGHTVSVAYNGNDALTRAKRRNPDVIFLDIGLSDMDGYEVARRLREENVQSVLIALTGYGQNDDKQRALRAGFDIHLTKPVGLRDLDA